MNIGQRLFEIRQYSHLSVTEVASYLHINTAYIHYWEQSCCMITKGNVERLAAIYSVPTWLFYGMSSECQAIGLLNNNTWSIFEYYSHLSDEGKSAAKRYMEYLLAKDTQKGETS